MAFKKSAYHHLSRLVSERKGAVCATAEGCLGTLPRQPVTGTRNDVEELRQRVEEVEHLRDEKKQHRFAEVPHDPHHGKSHAGKVAEGVPNKHSRWVPAIHRAEKQIALAMKMTLLPLHAFPCGRSGAKQELRQTYAAKSIAGIYAKNCGTGTRDLACGKYGIKKQLTRCRRERILCILVSRCDRNCSNKKKSC